MPQLFAHWKLGFYLTDEECKLSRVAAHTAYALHGFYLTDEECKFGYNLVGDVYEIVFI